MKRLWSNSLAFKFFLSFLALISVLSLSFYFYAGAILKNFYVSSLSARMDREARLIAAAVPPNSEGLPLDAITRHFAEPLDTRVTVIAADGRVLGDSAEASTGMENHAGRPEVIEALAKGSGSSVRYSTTVGHDLLYRAVVHDYGEQKRVIRLAYPLSEVDETTTAIASALLVGLLAASALALLTAWAFTYHLSRRFARLVTFSQQLTTGSFPTNFFTGRGRDEINVLEGHLNEMSRKLHSDIQQIVAEKEKLDSILRCMVEGVLVIDPKGQVATINQQAKKIFGIPGDRDPVGLSVAELSRRPEMLAMMHEVLATTSGNRSFTKEIELDEGRWFRINGVSLKDAAQETCGSILVFHDISEIKRLETVRSDFVANVSHELRTPLTAIRGYVETLLRSPPHDPAQVTQFLAIIDRNTTRLSRLTEDLLILSDLESGKVPLVRTPVAVAKLAQRVFEVFWDAAERKRIKLIQDFDRDLPAVFGDFDRLQQLFINLVDNAIKYTPAQGTVTFRAEAMGDGFVDISIADTGLGIPAKDIPRLTERFYRVDRARSRELGGTGLGLAIVKHIVHAHDGRLKIDSVMHQGTTVHIYLPATLAQDAVDDEPERTPVAAPR